jgi:hypothetical protein
MEPQSKAVAVKKSQKTTLDNNIVTIDEDEVRMLSEARRVFIQKKVSFNAMI